MGYKDKVEQTFRARTEMAAPDALAKARQVLEQLDHVGTWRLRVVQETDRGFTVAIKATVIGALTDTTTFVVSVDDADGGSEVDARISNFSVYQDKFLFFIPAGPKSVPGLKAYGRSLDALRAAFA